MSQVYYLVCIDTAEALNLGKIVSLDHNDIDRPIGFGGWRDQETGIWIEEPRLLAMVSRFLILNRGKQLRIMPESLLNQIDIDDKMKYFESYEDMMNTVVHPEPDPEAEISAIPVTVKYELENSLRNIQKRLG